MDEEERATLADELDCLTEKVATKMEERARIKKNLQAIAGKTKEGPTEVPERVTRAATGVGVAELRPLSFPVFKASDVAVVVPARLYNDTHAEAA